MLSRMHNKLGTAGLVVSIVALVAALAGGAYAAAGFTKAQEKQITKIAKKYAGKPGKRGKPGAPGAAGPAGPAGAQGAKGDAGTNGTNGTNGEDGEDGEDGKSPAGTPFTGSKTLGSVTCTEGGVEYKGATNNLVCNGTKGTTGFTDTLPAGKSETGVWSTGQLAAPSTSSVLLSFSFPIPLADGSSYTVNWLNKLEEAKVGEAANCPGNVLDPEAKPGNLCVYTLEEEKTKEQFTPAFPDEAGTLAIFNLEAGGSAFGTWAVTAPTTP